MYIICIYNVDGVDYESTSAVVTFRNGEMLQNVAIVIIDDVYVEPTEYFSVRLKAIGHEVVVFPITECAIRINDNDCKYDTIYDITLPIFFHADIQIGFSETSLVIDSTELTLDVSNYHGIMQSGEISSVQLQIESLSGIKTDFYQHQF